MQNESLPLFWTHGSCGGEKKAEIKHFHSGNTRATATYRKIENTAINLNEKLGRLYGRVIFWAEVFLRYLRFFQSGLVVFLLVQFLSLNFEFHNLTVVCRHYHKIKVTSTNFPEQIFLCLGFCQSLEHDYWKSWFCLLCFCSLFSKCTVLYIFWIFPIIFLYQRTLQVRSLLSLHAFLNFTFVQKSFLDFIAFHLEMQRLSKSPDLATLEHLLSLTLCFSCLSLSPSILM